MASILATMMLLGGCSEAPAGWSGAESEETSSTTGTSTISTTTTASPAVEIPEPVTGTYNGQTVTMKYVTVTNYIWPMDNLRPYAFINGYVPFYYYKIISDEEILVGGSYLDKKGNMLCDPIYKTVFPFNAEGRALAQRMEDNVWVYIDTTGMEVGESKDPEGEQNIFGKLGDVKETNMDSNGFVNGLKVAEQGKGIYVIVNENDKVVTTLPSGLQNASLVSENMIICTFGGESDGPLGEYTKVYDTNGNPLNDMQFERIGAFNNGLAPFLIDGKLGVMDDKGNIIIPATYSVNVHFYDRFFVHDNLLLINTDGKISIIEIAFS